MKTAVLVTLAGLILVLNAMAASPSLHQWLHPDANESAHQCAVTLFAHGKVDSAGVDVVVAAPQSVIAAEQSFQISVYRPAIENLPAGRAPPLSASNS